MAKTRRNRKPEGAATPPPKQTSKKQTESFDHPAQGGPYSLQRIREDGFLTMAEVAIGTLVIALLLVTAVLTLRVTERGSVLSKQEQDALDLAKGRAEELKSYMASENWNNMQVDVRFPPTQTPVINSYSSFSPQTVIMGKNSYILDPEIRYVYSASTSQLQPLPTPQNVSTPEYSDMVRIRVDAYYGPANQFVPLPTAEITGRMANRVVYTNVLANHIINADITNSISGHLVNSNNCDTTVVIPGALVGLYSSATTQQVMTSVTNYQGYFSFQKVPVGTYYVLIASAPGYSAMSSNLAADSCNMTEPVTVTSSQAVTDIWIGAKPLVLWNYYGWSCYVTPGVTPFNTPNSTNPPTPSYPTITPTAVVAAANAIVFSDDGNSSPVTANSSGAYTITGVRATPVSGHNFDSIEADVSSPSTLIGQNYNSGYTGGFVQGGQTYIGPVSLFINSSITNTMPVTFLVYDFDSNAAVSNTYMPTTVTVVDGSPTSPSTVFGSGSGSVTAILTCRFPAVENVSVNVSHNSPVGYQTFNQGMEIDQSIPQPVTLYNYAVGSIAGTVAGMGASFDYSQFTVLAQDTNNEFLYQIPVVNDSASASAFGTFSTTVRTPNNAFYGGDPSYIFSVNSNGNFSSNSVETDVKWGHSQSLPSTILVSLLNAYMAVTVTQKGSAYPYGAWISAQEWPGATPTPPSAPPTTGMGQSFTVDNYFSTITKGDGTSEFQIQLFGGGGTKYTVTAQIVDPNTYAVTQQAQTITVPTTAGFTSPQGVSFGF